MSKHEAVRHDRESYNNIIRETLPVSSPEKKYAFPRGTKDIQLTGKDLENFKHIKVAIGVGGAFDFLVGKAKRAPSWMRSAGLEWLYRLINEPKRIVRIYRAVIVFPWKVLVNSYQSGSNE